MLQTVDEHDPYEISRQELNGLTILAYRDLHSCWNISVFQFESVQPRLANELRKPQILPERHQRLSKGSFN